MRHSALMWAVALSAVYLAGGYLLALIALLVNAVGVKRGRHDRAEDLASLAVSRFTIPVSVIVPALNDERMIVASVESLLQLNYPEFEVIVVSDGSTDRTMDRLREAFEIQPREIFYRKRLPALGVHKIYRSVRDPRLVVVEKDQAGKADALSC